MTIKFTLKSAIRKDGKQAFTVANYKGQGVYKMG